MVARANDLGVKKCCQLRVLACQAEDGEVSLDDGLGQVDTMDAHLYLIVVCMAGLQTLISSMTNIKSIW